ncbi:CTP synthase [Bifidobacterium leontopitheci]|uniref:CTP synthase n=1 Tax=Bifidobacterium leontopitheci TaxID=2650774 RepID=A0A6I1GFR8_9BIFI|nr:CTP synthase [Bifidobacterium leontopitheci]KAB7790395.1 CTP synthase [Bifidobacterium leontopitheci]
MNTTSARIDTLISRAQHDQRCAHPETHNDYKAMVRRCKAGKLVNPYPGLFSDAMYWRSLDATEQILHIVRSLAKLHPTWVFAGPTAAAIHGLEHQWSIQDRIYIADAHQGNDLDPGKPVNRIYMAEIPVTVVNGIRAVTMERTVLDCARLLTFPHALAVSDSAFRRIALGERGWRSDASARIRAFAGRIRGMTQGLRNADAVQAVEQVLRYTDPASENGGESFMRGAILEERYMPPQLQRQFASAARPNNGYRADYTWTTADGRIIVGEFDGMGKYVDPAMAGRASIQEIVNRQNAREQDLLAAGAHLVFRLTFDDALHRTQLVTKLDTAGVPRNGEALDAVGDLRKLRLRHSERRWGHGYTQAA